MTIVYSNTLDRVYEESPLDEVRPGIDIDAAVQEKIQINNAKYPVSDSYGNSAKYNELKKKHRS